MAKAGPLEGIKKIKAWELADRFVVEVYRVTRHFPREEQKSK